MTYQLLERFNSFSFFLLPTEMVLQSQSLWSSLNKISGRTFFFFSCGITNDSVHPEGRKMIRISERNENESRSLIMRHSKRWCKSWFSLFIVNCIILGINRLIDQIYRVSEIFHWQHHLEKEAEWRKVMYTMLTPAIFTQFVFLKFLGST